MIITKEEAKEYASIIQAFANNIPLECKLKTDNKWMDCYMDVLHFNDFDYRIK